MPVGSREQGASGGGPPAASSSSLLQEEEEQVKKVKKRKEQAEGLLSPARGAQERGRRRAVTTTAEARVAVSRLLREVFDLPAVVRGRKPASALVGLSPALGRSVMKHTATRALGAANTLPLPPTRLAVRPPARPDRPSMALPDPACVRTHHSARYAASY
jgi:hypothetical protein